MIASNRTPRSVRRAAYFFAAAAFCLTLFSSAAKAGSVKPGKEIDFKGGAGGTFTYTIGLGDTASVENAPENIIISFPSYLKLSIQDGTLDFTTGPCIATCKVGKLGGFAYSVPQFGKGGSLTLFGGIPGLGIKDGTELLKATFIPFRGNTAVGMSLSGNPHQQSGMTAMIQILFVNPALLAYFNFNPHFTGGKGDLSDILMHLAFMSGSWDGGILSSDMLIDPSLPEPSSLILLGTAMLFLAYLVRRKVGVNHAAGSASQV